MTVESTLSPTQRKVRFVDIPWTDVEGVGNGIESLYDDTLDVIVVRGAFPRGPLEQAGADLDRDDRNPGWARPNEKMPVEDIQLLGTDTPATPTYQAPRGASLESYLESAKRHGAAMSGVFDDEFDANRAIHDVLARFSGGRPVEPAATATGEPYVPFTVRRLVDGKQIGLHHDYHYPLALYNELVPRVDTGTLVSYVTVLRSPEAGGELCVYAVTPTTPDPPKMANGFSWDLDAVEQRFDGAKFTLDIGDFFLLASGRCLHRVAPIRGSRARVTMGGFLALDRDRRRVLYWS
jgi:hypothetical protein